MSSKNKLMENIFAKKFEHKQIEHTHRSNPLQPDLITNYVDAIEISKSIMISLNASFGNKKEDFLEETSINFVSICIWALKLKSDDRNSFILNEIENLSSLKVQEEKKKEPDLNIIKKIEDTIKSKKSEQYIYCSLPHLIELVSKPYDELFPFLSTFKDDLSISNVLAPFVLAWENDTDLLDKQIALVRLGLSRLSTYIIYYLMTTGKYLSIFNHSKTGLTKEEILTQNFLRIKKDIDDLVEETIGVIEKEN